MRLALNMIVKNEAAIIERCLTSVVPYIDRFDICDTGSTDGTLDRIRDFFRARGIPGDIKQIEFHDFAQARNEALDLFRASGADWALFMDADHEFKVIEHGWRDYLSSPVQMVRVVSPGLEYYVPRLLHRDVPARFVGATHEYLDARGARQDRLENIQILDHADGGCRQDKFERDIRLLTEELSREPNNPRTIFYLANSLRDLGRFAEAVHWYRQRVELGGWDEEVWYARYQIAICYRALGDIPKFIDAAWEAYNSRPARAEPLFALAQHYRIHGQFEAACAVAEIGLTIPPSQDILFIETDVYRTGFLDELSVCGYYSALATRHQAGRDACHRLMQTDVPPVVRHRAASNFRFYEKLLPVKASVPPVHRLIETDPSIDSCERQRSSPHNRPIRMAEVV